MGEPVTRIVVVGGGTAGWLSACYLAAKSRSSGVAPVSVTLIESPDIPTVGVGEGTWPTMRGTLADIGLDESDVLRSCDGSLKQGSRFDGWLTGELGDSYYHPFTAPPEGEPIDLISAWRELAPESPFAATVSPQPAVCDAGLAPRQAAMPAYAGALNYAYHLDAAKLAALLARHGVNQLGITQLRDEVVSVEAREAGEIDAVITRSGTRAEGDLFIDCSGYRGVLIADHCGTEWIKRSDILFNDRALAVQVAVEDSSPIQSTTIATAHEAGWIWDIGLPARRGIGCVYSSRFMDDQTAERVLRDYVSAIAGDGSAHAISPRALTFRSGHRAEFWRGNCLAIGLSAGFVEPLEASAIVMIELSLRALADNFPATREVMPIHAERFNQLSRTRWDRIVEFLKLHYLLSQRKEPYWCAHREPESVPRRLTELVRLWRDQPPSAYDLPLAEEIFPAASYQYVYYGMAGELPHHLPSPKEKMRRNLEQVRQRARGLLMALPSNRALLASASAQLADSRIAKA
jgi:hypothetical protein